MEPILPYKDEIHMGKQSGTPYGTHIAVYGQNLFGKLVGTPYGTHISVYIRSSWDEFVTVWKHIGENRSGEGGRGASGDFFIFFNRLPVSVCATQNI